MQTKRTGFTILLFIIFLGFILPSCQAQQDQNITALSPKEASKLIETRTGDSDFIILDIRTPGEYQSGHLKDAIIIDYYSKSFADEIGRLNKSRKDHRYGLSKNLGKRT